VRARQTKLVLAAVVLTLAVVIAWLAFRGPRRPDRLNVVLISIDTLRADHVGCYGHPGDITPNMDRLADDGVRFSRVVSPVPLTLPSHATMLTGLIPPAHGIHKNESYRLAEAHNTLAEILKTEGYATAAFVSSFILDAQFGLAQGFDVYDDDFRVSAGRLTFSERRGQETARLAIDWLDARERDEPFFLFVHFYDPHTAYNPPPTFAARWPGNPYAGEVAYVDDCVGQVIDRLRGLGVYDETLIVVVSDHGEMLGEHGELTHGLFIYESAINVPLIVKQPQSHAAGTVVDGAMGLVDVTPTICALLGLDGADSFQGRYLLAAMDGAGSADPGRYLYCESVTAETYDANPLFGMAGPRWKYIETTEPELYDLAADPDETTNVIEAHRHRARELSDRLHGILADAEATAAGSRAELDAAAEARLASLGYVVGGGAATFLIQPDKDDPKQLVAFHRDMQEAVELSPAGRHEEVLALVEPLVKQRPQVFVARRQLAITLAMLGRHAEALDHYDILIEDWPDDAHLLAHRARSRQETDDLAGALADCDRAIRLDPETRGVWYIRGLVHLRRNEFDKAIEDFGESLGQQPNHVPSLMNRGTAREHAGDLAGAIADYSAAIRSQPGLIEAYVLRAKAMKKAGDIQGAVAGLQRCLAFIPPGDAKTRKEIAGIARQLRDEP